MQTPNTRALVQGFRAALVLLITITLGVACKGPEPAPGDSAVFCAECKTVWVLSAEYDDPYQIYSVPTEISSCVDCENAVYHFFKTGRFGHDCKSCGDSLVHCQYH